MTQVTLDKPTVDAVFEAVQVLVPTELTVMVNHELWRHRSGMRPSSWRLAILAGERIDITSSFTSAGELLAFVRVWSSNRKSGGVFAFADVDPADQAVHEHLDTLGNCGLEKEPVESRFADDLIAIDGQTA